MIWKLLPQIISILIVSVTIALDYFFWDKRTSNFRNCRLTLCALCFVLLVFSIISAYKDEKEGEALRAQLLRLENAQTGGSSYCYVQPRFFLDRYHKTNVTLEVWPSGANTVLDVIVESNFVKEDGTIDAQSKRTFNLGNLGPVLRGTYLFEINKTNQGRYKFVLRFRNGGVSEDLVVRARDGLWDWAYRFTDPHTIVFKETNSNHGVPPNPW
jgi:hypothetical protein